MGKVKGSKLSLEATGRAPGLTEQILEDKSLKQSSRSKVRRRKENDDDVSTRN